MRELVRVFVAFAVVGLLAVGCAPTQDQGPAVVVQESKDALVCRVIANGDPVFTFEEDVQGLSSMGVRPFGEFRGEQAKRFVAATGGEQFPWFVHVKRVVIWTTPDNIYLVGVYNDACRLAAGTFNEESIHGALRKVGYNRRAA